MARAVWTRLPFWLQGGFIGGLVILPAGLLLQVVAAVVGTTGRRRRADWLLAAASACALAIVVAGFVAPAGAGSAATGPGSDSPGCAPLPIASLQLPVPRAFDLSHVDPAHFAVALGKDPVRSSNSYATRWHTNHIRAA